MSDVIICGGDYVYRWRVGQCWGSCNIADSIIISSEGSPYYAPTQTCTNCGDKWSDGELWGRPFARGWRREAIARAQANFERSCRCPVQRDANDLYPLPCRKHGEAGVA